VWNVVLCVAAESGRVRAGKKILFCYTGITGGYAFGFSVFAFWLEGAVLLGCAAAATRARRKRQDIRVARAACVLDKSVRTEKR
jgi:hypothetical protein